MVEKFEMPASVVSRLVKDGAASQGQNVIVTKEAKPAFNQLTGFFILYLSSM